MTSKELNNNPEKNQDIEYFWDQNSTRTVNENENYFAALKLFYNSSDNMTLELVGQGLGVTRERARQYLEKGRNVLRSGISKESELYSIIKKAAEECMEISLVSAKDKDFTSSGICKMMADVFPEDFTIVKNSRLYGEWLTEADAGTGEMLDALIDELDNRPNPMKISDIMNVFPIKEDMLMSLKDLMEKGGYVTLSTNKEASRTGTSQKVLDCLESLGRPALASEIAELTGLNKGQVRTALGIDDNFVNVGKSLYDLEYADYSDLEIPEIARNYLIANQKAMKIDSVVSYVRLYIAISENEILKEILKSTGKLGVTDGYIFLAELGPESIQLTKKKKYDVPLDAAILEIINSSDRIYKAEHLQKELTERYGNKVSTNLNSIASFLARLCQEGKIIRAGGEMTGCYQRNKEYIDAVLKDLQVVGADDSGEETAEDDLSGWTRDVWECVKKFNGATFDLSGIYQFVGELKEKHPNNNNIEAKIRQQLQVLRDKGFLEFDGDGRYRVI